MFIDAVLIVAMGFPLASCGRTAFVMTSEKKKPRLRA